MNIVLLWLVTFEWLFLYVQPVQLLYMIYVFCWVGPYQPTSLNFSEYLQVHFVWYESRWAS